MTTFSRMQKLAGIKEQDENKDWEFDARFTEWEWPETSYLIPLSLEPLGAFADIQNTEVVKVHNTQDLIDHANHLLYLYWRLVDSNVDSDGYTIPDYDQFNIETVEISEFVKSVEGFFVKLDFEIAEAVMVPEDEDDGYEEEVFYSADTVAYFLLTGNPEIDMTKVYGLLDDPEYPSKVEVPNLTWKNLV
jgi:hypothetical protein